MKEISININRHHHRLEANAIAAWVCGPSARENTYFDIEALARLVVNELQNGRVDLANLLQTLSGHWCLVWASGDSLWCAVDRMRSIPLFYAVEGDRAYISDDAYSLQEKIGPDDIDAVARTEYLLTGYVTGNQTLSPYIKQIQPGQVVRLTYSEGAWKISTERYFTFTCRYDLTGGSSRILDQYTTLLDEAFVQTLKWLSGRPIMLPLSGGWDSKLMALMLHRHGYKNVTAFSYGIPGNADSTASKLVAQCLGMPWHFVEYSNDKWFHWFRSEMMKEYLSRSDRLCAHPYITSWPAVLELTDRGVVNPDSVFMPGLSIGAYMGSIIPPVLVQLDKPGKEGVLDAIWRKHFQRMWRLDEPGVNPEGLRKNTFHERICNSLGDGTCDFRESAASAYELWEWQERQSKAIASMISIYDFWGYAWHLPYMDAHLLDFCTRLPLSCRFQKRLLKVYVSRLFASATGQPATSPEEMLLDLPAHKICPPPSFAQVAVKNMKLAAAKVLRKQPEQASYEGHPLALYGAIPIELYRKTLGWSRLPHAYWIAYKLGLYPLQ